MVKINDKGAATTAIKRRRPTAKAQREYEAFAAYLNMHPDDLEPGAILATLEARLQLYNSALANLAKYRQRVVELDAVTRAQKQQLESALESRKNAELKIGELLAGHAALETRLALLPQQ